MTLEEQKQFLNSYFKLAERDKTHFKFYWGTNQQLSPHFQSNEFACLGASRLTPQYISVTLIDRLERVREKYGKPLLISSGFRTLEKQEYLRMHGYETAKGISQHMLGCAVDILSPTDELIKLLKEEFDAIGLATSFTHVDERKDKKREWTYADGR